MARNRKLGRVSSHRKAMLRNLATDVIMYGKIETTVTRAKEVRSIVDELITLAKRGDLHARRQAAEILQDVVDPATGKTAVQKLFDEVAPQFAEKSSGYTRVLKTYNRKGCLLYTSSHIHAQIIDDVNGVTLVAASSVDMKLAKGGNVEAATQVGKEIAKRAIAKNIENVVFDRGGYIYHGRVKALAEAAREAGLKF